MAQARVTVSVSGAGELHRLARRLRHADLRRHIRDELADTGRPVVPALRAAVMDVDVRSARGGNARPDQSTGLRRRVAANTDMSTTRSGISFRAHSRRVDPRYPQLVAYLNAGPGRFRRWPHPVFATGDRSGWEWTVQFGEPWFFATVRRRRTRFRQAVRRGVYQANQEITG